MEILVLLKQTYMTGKGVMITKAKYVENKYLYLQFRKRNNRAFCACGLLQVAASPYCHVNEIRR